MQSIHAANSGSNVRPIRPEAALSEGEGEDRQASGYRDVTEILLVGAVWLLAVIQVGIGFARGGAWTPDSTLAIAFVLACPIVLRALLPSSPRKPGSSGSRLVG